MWRDGVYELPKAIDAVSNAAYYLIEQADTTKLDAGCCKLLDDLIITGKQVSSFLDDTMNANRNSEMTKFEKIDFG